MTTNPTGWQKIDSAPKDREIRVFLNGISYHAVFERMGGNPINKTRWPLFTTIGVAGEKTFAPTHWKEIDDPPETDE